MDEENELINSDLEDHSESIETPENSDVDDDNEEQDEGVEQARSELESESEEYSSEDVPRGGNTKLLWTTLKNVLPIQKIATYGIIAAVAVILLAFLISIIGAISHHPYEYIAPRCTQMSVTFGSGEDAITDSLSMEQYLVSHIYSATKNLKNVDPHLYKTLAIVLNTQVQSAAICRETIIPEEEDIYDFEVLEQESEIYQTILDAIQTEKDLVMVNEENESFYQTSLDGFCYNNFYQDMNVATPPNSSEEDEDISLDDESNSYFTLQQLNYQFPMKWVVENIPDERFYRCPCNFPEGAVDPSLCYILRYENEEDEEPERIYVDGGSGVGVSIYGAHYLSSEKGESYQSILKMFYPNGDWILMSTDESLRDKDFSANCIGGVIPYTYTPLSKNEFVRLVTEFLTPIKDKTYYNNYFIEYAEDIYDMGLEKGINPELIYIFARKEVGFTQETSDTARFNYWGLGHGNNSGSGFSNNSFMEGVEKQFNYFAKFDSLESVVPVYSSLGNILYNFDNRKEMGLGGCYYMRYIYGNNYSRCSSSYHCEAYFDSKGNVIGHSSSCVNTTEEEKEAYIKWQAEKLISHREVIFHLGKEMCYGTDLKTEANLNVPTQQLKYSLRQFLESNHSSITSLNEMIKNKVLEVGVGTRSSVAVAATTLINYMAQYNLRIPYTFGGGHGGYSFNGYNKSISSYFGVDPDWGTPITGAGKYTHYGPDCSSFVNWAMKNGGMKHQGVWTYSSQDYKNIGTVHAMNGSYIGQVGDVVFSSGHIRLIVGVNIQEQYYITAESQTNSAPYAPEFKGISYQQMSFSDSNYRIVDLTRFYDNASNRYTNIEYNTAFNGSSTK